MTQTNPKKGLIEKKTCHVCSALTDFASSPVISADHELLRVSGLVGHTRQHILRLRLRLLRLGEQVGGRRRLALVDGLDDGVDGVEGLLRGGRRVEVEERGGVRGAVVFGRRGAHQIGAVRGRLKAVTEHGAPQSPESESRL